MTADKCQALVDEAVSLDRTIAELQERLDAIKNDLILAARDLDGTRTDGGGLAVVIEGRECISRVVFPGPSLKASIKKTDKDFPKILALAGDVFQKLFRPSTSCKPVPDFRESARLLLDKDKAARLIRLCEKDSPPTVSFETTEKFGEEFFAAEK